MSTEELGEIVATLEDRKESLSMLMYVLQQTVTEVYEERHMTEPVPQGVA